MRDLLIVLTMMGIVLAPQLIELYLTAKNN
ncbi:hypothetical protein DFR80_1235 [Halanaerobium sp. ST460_2HS_T2]|jgi:hypothetical protein|uniref:Uncharacterized protein n=1 Tax=Halanaerobium kushneri TaxID=56779 RepID=A0A1N6TRB1_9FIRM|nr:hypothetical protein DFR80_1235 [Halanaerobium sp. ST460_2HS_T2]SIQ55881.1 hypothetical protein SAMN05421834_105145 [Halanaerobium kushneri]